MKKITRVILRTIIVIFFFAFNFIIENTNYSVNAVKNDEKRLYLNLNDEINNNVF